MMDFNSRAQTADHLNGAIDTALVAQDADRAPRPYLGGSRLGHPCERALQFEFADTFGVGQHSSVGALQRSLQPRQRNLISSRLVVQVVVLLCKRCQDGVGIGELSSQSVNFFSIFLSLAIQRRNLRI